MKEKASGCGYIYDGLRNRKRFRSDAGLQLNR
jgi:hypothetical protein